MTDLGCLIITDSNSIVKVRKKIRLALIKLGFSVITSTRIEALLSDLLRRVTKEKENATVGLQICEDSIGKSIIISIGCKEETLNCELTEGFFDEVKIDKKQDSRYYISLKKYFEQIPDQYSKGLIEEVSQDLLQKSREELMEEIAEKNKELLIAKNIAEEAAKVKSDFLANMSHEIRTPMNAIMGMTYLIQKTNLTNKQKDYIDKIHRSSQHLLGVINDILDFSKIEAGKLDIEYTEFNLRRVLENLSDLIGDKCREKGLELVFDVDSEISYCLYGDQLRLSQILINYANNAVKFTEKGEIIVRIKMISREEENYFIRFEVKDTGIGLTDEQKDRLFQSFQQADTSTTRKYGGTGLGLAISKRLANLMGGEVGVDSEYGKGSTFWFTVMLKAGSKIEDVVASDINIVGRRVLVVDDNEQARNILADMLTAMSLRVDKAESGQKAVEMTIDAGHRNDFYEIIFMDMQMPEMNGIEAYTKIISLDIHDRPRCIMVTGYGREEIFHEADKAGIDLVLVKPVNPMVLYESVIRVCGGEISRDKNSNMITDTMKITSIIAGIRGANILLVEDNDLNQQVAMELLEEGEFQTDIADNGAIALEKVSEKKYDIILMDMQMPVMDGLEATRRIRSSQEYAKLPIIAMTANAMEKDRQLCLESGMNDHIAKPIDPEQLFLILSKWIPQRHKVDAEAGYGKRTKEVKLEKKLDIDIDGLDVESGMRRVLGKQNSYIKLLRKYVEQQKNFTDEINHAFDACDYDTAQRLAHTLKGVSGNIGAVEILRKAAVLEEAIKEKQAEDIIKEYTIDVGKTLNIMRNKIEKILPADEVITVKSGEESSTDALISQLKIIRPFVKTRKPKKCTEMLSSYRELIWPLNLHKDAEDLDKLITKYKFKEALELLDELLKKLGGECDS
ncbi:MAG: response regulator [Velocimicrobium sp.]